MKKTLACVALLLATLLSQTAGASGLKVQAVEVELIADRVAIRPGEPFKLGLRIRHDPHWHTYWRNPGDSGLPTQLSLTLPPGLQAGPIEWVTPQVHRVGPLANFGYDGEIVLPVTVQTPVSLPGDTARMDARAEWLVCKEVCVPGEANLSLQLPIDRVAAALPSDHAGLFDAMAARSPSKVLRGLAAIAGGQLSLLVQPLGSPAADATVSVEPPQIQFFPYEPGLIDNPAPQRLFDLGADGEGRPRWRLAVPVADGADRTKFEQALFFDQPSGLVIVDGEAFEWVARSVSSLPAGEPLQLTASAPAVATTMLGGSAMSTGKLASASVDSGNSPASALGGAGTMTLAFAMLFALLGGVLLNLMPCVFPVIGLKVLGFAQQAASSNALPGAAMSRGMRQHALWFTAGVLTSFWLLAGVLLALQAAGQAVGWGFQMQSPVVVAGMALLFVAIGLNLSGVFELGSSLTRLGQYDSGTHGRASALMSGALAVAVATPCSAPFMGSALGFTLGRPSGQILLVFTALGLGMALPYLILGWFPGWLRRLPRPGRWMQSLRQFLAFPMYATAAWLAWVLAQQAGLNALLGWLAGAITLSLAAWLYGRFGQANSESSTQASSRYRPIVIGLGIIVAMVAVWLAWPPAVSSSVSTATLGQSSEGGGRAGDAAARWGVWSPDAVEKARASGRPVFVDFTAAWCVTCQVNKKLVLDSRRIADEMERRQVIRLRADWTRLDATIRAELARHGRSGVPLYLVFKPGEMSPQILPEVLTPGIVLTALGE